MVSESCVSEFMPFGLCPWDINMTHLPWYNLYINQKHQQNLKNQDTVCYEGGHYNLI